MLKSMCTHMGDTITDWNEISLILKDNQQSLGCSDCECRGPNLWLCLKKNCGHIGCSEKSNDHNTIHNANNLSHSIHLNLSTQRVWCYDCRSELFLHKKYINGYESDQEDNGLIVNDSGHGSYATLRANSPERGAIFENSVGLNVGMSGDGDASDSSDVEGSGDFGANKGLVGLQNIGNTCYMNAALQALSNTEALTRYFIDCEKIVYMLSEGKKPGLSRTYQTLVKDMWVRKGPHTFVTPSGILYGIRNVHAMFRGYHQHDTQEFLRNFMDQLHEELKQPEIAQLNEADTFSLAVEEPQNSSLSYDSSEGEEYETCDSGVSERSSLSDDSEAQAQAGDGRSSGISSSAPGSLASKRRLSRCQSPGRRQRPRVSSQSVIDAQPTQKKPQIKHRSIISDIFDGKLLSSVQCLTCDRVSRRVETFQDLSLPIPSRDHLVVLHGRAALPNATCSDVLVPIQDGWVSWIIAWLSLFRSWWYGPMVTLHDCLAAFFSTDELKGDNMYSCEKCNKLRNGIKFSKVLQLPEVLCIHLKRFRHEVMYSSKISSAVSFPLKGLDMWPYLHAKNTSRVSNYDLFSVICHHGTAGGGHYTSYALNGDKWYEFDDQYVSQVPAEKVQNCEAYVLFYRKAQKSAEGVRLKVGKMREEAERQREVKRVFVARQWITKFYYCVEPGPIDNSDFLCQHGAFDPQKKHDLENVAVALPLEVYEYLHKKFGGCPPIVNAVVCPACQALQQRMLSEMEMFLDVSKKFELNPRTHYLSTSWYMQWHAFIQKTSGEPPGPIDNSRIDVSSIDTDEAAEVSRPLWEFFHNIYGGGPCILVRSEGDSEEEEGEEEGEVEPPPLHEESFSSEKGDGPDVSEEVIEQEEEEEGMEEKSRRGESEEVPASSPPPPKAKKKGSKYRRRNH